MSPGRAVLLAALLAAVGGEWGVRLVDVAQEAGLTQASVYGGLEHKRFIIETNGAGVAWIDYDNDGWVDALVLSGTRLEEGSRQRALVAAGRSAHEPPLSQQPRRDVP